MLSWAPTLPGAVFQQVDQGKKLLHNLAKTSCNWTADPGAWGTEPLSSPSFLGSLFVIKRVWHLFINHFVYELKFCTSTYNLTKKRIMLKYFLCPCCVVGEAVSAFSIRSQHLSTPSVTTPWTSSADRQLISSPTPPHLVTHLWRHPKMALLLAWLSKMSYSIWQTLSFSWRI